MSIHAQLSAEAQARLAAQRRNSTITSVVISILVIVILGLVLGIFLLPNLIKESPTIVTYQANDIKEKEPEPEKVKNVIQRKPSSPSSSMVKVIAASTTSTVSIPVPDVVVTTESVDFGDGEDFGGGWGDGNGFGKGGGATFFNQSVKAERIAYVIDYSGSMGGEKNTLMRSELTKSVGGLKAGTKFQMIFFAGPAWVAGSVATAKGGTGLVKGDGKKEYEWTGKGAHNWQPVGKRQEVEWLDMSAKQMKESLKTIEESKLVWGTDWSNPLEMAFEMDPAPQIIFFMTDGSTGGDMMKLTDDLASKARNKGIMVNCVALMEPKAEEPMFNLANKTGGVFTIVEKGGKIREIDRLKKKKK
jgi:hypothetical protein